MQQDAVHITEDGSIHVEKNKEWVLETDGVNLKTVICIDGVDFMRTYLNSCLEIFNILSEAVDLYTLRVFQLQGAHQIFFT